MAGSNKILQNALPEIAKITQNLKNFIESPDEEFIDSLLLEIRNFTKRLCGCVISSI